MHIRPSESEVRTPDRGVVTPHRGLRVAEVGWAVRGRMGDERVFRRCKFLGVPDGCLRAGAGIFTS